MIFIILGFVLIIYSHFDFKKSFMIYLCYKLFLVTNITLISIPGIPILSLDVFMTLLYIFIYLINGKKYQCAHYPFPLFAAFSILTISYFLSAVFSVAGFGSEMSALIKSISQEILLIWLIWEIVEDEKDFQFIFKGLTIIFFISCIYGLVECLIQQNPLVQYEATLNRDSSKVISWTYDTASRGYRIQSIFEHPIGAGINWSIYFISTLWLWINQKKYVNIFSIITAILCVPCIILTRMRGPLLFCIIFAMCLINIKKKKFYGVLVLGVLILFVFRSLFQNNINIILSFFDKAAQSSVGGSSMEMRLSQFDNAFQILAMKPLFGFGQKYQGYLEASLIHGLYGGESVWLQTIVSYGFLGLFAVVFYYFNILITLPNRFKLKGIGFLALAYIITFSATSVPGMQIYLFYFFYFFMIKSSSIYYENKMERTFGLYFSSLTKIKVNPRKKR